MSEFYDEYTDDETDTTEPIIENELSSISKDIEKMMEKYNMGLDKTLQELQTKLNNKTPEAGVSNLTDNNNGIENNGIENNGIENNGIETMLENHEIINS